DLDAHLQYNESVRVQLDGVLANPREDFVYWIETGAGQHGGSVALHAAPLDVGEMLHRELFDAKDATVLTSATLSTGGELRYIEERVWVGPPQGVVGGAPVGSAAPPPGVCPPGSPQRTAAR